VGVKVRAAVVGTGFMGRVHMEALRRLGNIECQAVHGRSESEVRAVLDDPSVTAIHICTPNALHFPMAEAALQSGKHVLCEKPLAMSAAEGRKLTELARSRGLRNCTCHNLRYYPMVQQMRRMREAGQLGDILVVQGTYSQDWLLYDTDWNWRIDSRENGPSRVMADIGSHWCDMTEHITGLRITAVCADLQTFHKVRKRPKGSVETFAGKALEPQDYTETPIDTEDFGAALIRLGDGSRGSFTASQVSAGRKNRLSVEIYGTKGSVAWDQERPDELWVGRRNAPNEILIKDPALLETGARPYADLPGGHSEGYDDTFKQVFRRFYQSIENPAVAPEYPQFSDGLRQLVILEAELTSHRRQGWVEVPAEP
jgi:predicted dehydrogenase